ncbi:zinc-finger of monoamine-oxidase A repressor R1, partial [Trifolium medium]|nr:zinc-finger of monoamine-oxidase A repressor R1 [Trifolium medium]
EEKKAAKSKVADAKGKERNVKLKLHNETAKAVMSTQLQDEKGKTVMSTELHDHMAEAVTSIEVQDEMADVVMSTEAQDEMAEAVVSTDANLSISDHETLLANLRSEADKVHTELLEAKGAIHK